MAVTQKMIWQMEMRLGEPLDLVSLADLCAVSPYHMARCFRQATGMSPMTYLRARRLSVAAEKIAASDTSILKIALDAQYNSHAAFTRAFASYFSVSPQTVRQARALHGLQLMEPLNMKEDMIVAVDAPRITTREAFCVAGLSAESSASDNSAIPPLWQNFNARMDEFDAASQSCAYGVCYGAGDDGHFHYMAGLEVGNTATIPQGMKTLLIPAGRYAVFQHKGHIADFPKTVYTIWNKALPDAGLEPRPAPDLEVYDDRFDAATGRGVVEIWIPVV